MKPKLLLHACCAPCSSGVIPQLIDSYDITLYYYNPNIDTLEEYNKRLQALITLVEIFNAQYQTSIGLISAPYNHVEFTTFTKGKEDEKEGGSRCNICFSLRLDATAKHAKENNFDMFASTLSVSPHKDHNSLNTIGDSLSQKHNITYLSNNFKKNNGYLLSIQNSKQFLLYRQTYCGCKKDNTN